MASLTQVVVQLQKEKKSIEGQLSKINSAVDALKGMGRGTAGKSAATGPRRVMSSSARKRIAAAQKARWAKWRAGKKKAA